MTSDYRKPEDLTDLGPAGSQTTGAAEIASLFARFRDSLASPDPVAVPSASIPPQIFLSRQNAPTLEDRYRVLVEQIPAVVFMAYLDGGISEAYVSPQVEQVLGFSREEWLDDPLRWYQQIHPDDRQRWSVEAAEILVNGTPLKSVYRVIARDGRVVWFRCEARVFRHADGRPWFVHGVGFDISDLKRAEAALREETDKREQLQALDLQRQIERSQQTESKLAAIVENSEDAIISKNLDGIITSWNKGAQLIFGYAPDEAIGQPVTIVIPPDRLTEEEEIIARLKRGEKIVHFETVRQRKDGTTLDVSVAISPLRSMQGEVIGASKIARDISARKQAELALQASEQNFRELAESLDWQVRERTRQLEERNAEVLKQSEDLRILSFQLLKAQDDERRRLARELHDGAGQILAVLNITLSQLIDDSASKAPELAKHAEQAERLVQQLTQDLRTTSYLLHPPLLDDIGLCAALEWYVQGLEKRSALKIELTIEKEFGRLASDLELLVYRFVQECLTNVHRHSGSRSAEICMARGARNITVEVRDFGKGIPGEKLQEVLSQGAGVGIRGMRERLRQFGGELTLDSTTSGTKVVARIPIPAGESSKNVITSRPLQASA